MQETPFACAVLRRIRPIGVLDMKPHLRATQGVLLSLAVGGLLLQGCVAQQSDLKMSEKDF